MLSLVSLSGGVLGYCLSSNSGSESIKISENYEQSLQESLKEILDHRMYSYEPYSSFSLYVDLMEKYHSPNPKRALEVYLINEIKNRKSTVQAYCYESRSKTFKERCYRVVKNAEELLSNPPRD